MRILFLAKRHYTNKDAFRERFGRVYQLPLQWSASGYCVSLELVDYRGLREEYASADGFEVRSVPLLNPVTLFRLQSRAREFRADVVIASGDCLVGVAGWQIARSLNARFVFDVYDDYSSFGSHRIFLGWNAFRYLRNRADLLLYASNSLAHSHACDSPWTLVPNGVDPNKFHPIATDCARIQLGINASSRLVGYFGSMEPDRGIGDLIAAVGQLHASDINIRLLLCGATNAGTGKFPSWVDYRGVVPHGSMATYMNACDALALPYRRGQTMDMGASCKIAEYLLCERPLVATDTPNFTSNFPKQAAELGVYLARPSDPQDLARAISLQLSHPKILSRPEGHTWSRIAGDTLAALEQITPRN